MKQLIKKLLRESLTVDKFSQLISSLSAQEVSGKPGFYYFNEGPSRLVFKKLGEKSTVGLELIETPEDYKGKGYAKLAINKFLNATDELRLYVELIIAPRDKKTSPEKLASLYKSFGFYFKDFSDFEMVRNPKR